MSKVNETTVDTLIQLSDTLGAFDAIKRATLLPSGENESDSHHSFSLALIAFELATEYAPELDVQKLLLYALVHDLPELITGDMNTLKATPEELEQKRQQDAMATKKLAKQLTFAPNIITALHAYEKKSDEESLFIFWLDKIVTVPTHFHDNGSNLKTLGILSKQDAIAWYERIVTKLTHEKKLGHNAVMTLLDLVHRRLRDTLL